MQIFKLCMKVIKKKLPIMSIYIGVFVMLSLIMSSNISKETEKEPSFVESKANIAVIAEESTPLTEGLIKELEKNADFVEIADDTEAIQDALYFRFATYILRIPEGFTQRFMSGEEVMLEKTVVPDSYTGVYIDMSVEKYLNTARLYVRNLKDIDINQLVEYVAGDMTKQTNLVVTVPEDKQVDFVYSNYFFNYFVYSLFSVLILGISTLMMVFNEDNLRKRNACSPIPAMRSSLQFFLAILVFTLVSWMIMVVCCVLFNLKNSININTVYFIINSFVYALSCAAMSFLIGNLIKGEGSLSAVTNVVALGSSFISGVFVPQELLGSTVLRIASFTPSYWFVNANNIIAKTSNFNLKKMEPVFSSMLIQLGFTVAFLAVALVVGKKKRYA